MSTICFEDERFIRVYNSLCHMDPGTLAHVWDYPEGWAAGLDAHFRSFVQALRIANIHAYNERYEENEPVRILSFNGGHSYSPIDLIKALRSVSYNIDDQNVNGCTDRLERLINCLMAEYISELPEYQQSDAW